MSKFKVEIIERGIELSNNDLFDVLGGANCVCYCFINFKGEKVTSPCSVDGALVKQLPGEIIR